MSEPSAVHATFVIERDYEAPVHHVFAAFADPEAKRRWFAEGDGWEIEQFEVDFKVGGRETARIRYQDGPKIRNDTVYQDIVPNRRIIIAYAMTVGGTRISASLATVEFEPRGAGTRLIYTEQGAFLDGRDQSADRQAGWGGLLDRLDVQLQRHMASA